MFTINDVNVNGFKNNDVVPVSLLLTFNYDYAFNIFFWCFYWWLLVLKIIFSWTWYLLCSTLLAGISLLKVNKRNTRIRCEICSKLTIKTPDRRYSGVFIVNFEHVFLLFLLLLWTCRLNNPDFQPFSE